MRPLPILLGLATLAGCQPLEMDAIAAPAYRATVRAVQEQIGPEASLWLAYARPREGVPNAEQHAAEVSSATRLSIWADALGPPRPPNVLLSLQAPQALGGDSVRVRVRGTIPFEVRGDTIRYDEIDWVVKLQCSGGACISRHTEVLEQTLFEVHP